MPMIFYDTYSNEFRDRYSTVCHERSLAHDI